MTKTIILLLITLFCFECSATTSKTIITINQFVQHPALDNARRGIEQSINNRLPGKVDIKVNNAQGNVANAAQIAQYQSSLHPDYMIGIATPSAQALNKYRSGKTILGFVAITDPVAAGLTANPKHTIGVTDAPPINELLNIITQVLPSLKTIGVIFNPGEVNSTKFTEQVIELATKRGLHVKKAAVNSVSDIKLSASKLVSAVDIIYLPQDNMVVSAIESLIQVANKAKIAVVTNDPDLLDKGILLAFGCNYFSSGNQLGNMIADMIEGKPLSTSIQPSHINKLKINHQVAKSLSIIIPQHLKSQEEQQ